MNQANAVFYLVELINCYGTVFYSNFLFFYMKSQFGFGVVSNLLLAALNGLVYIFASWYGGSFAQRFGCIRSLVTGLTGIAGSLGAGLFFHSVPAQLIVFASWTMWVCFTWPALEAIVSGGSSSRLSDAVGLYNITWAAGGAAAYFTAGMFLEHFGMQSLFWFPMSLVPIQMLLVVLAVHLTHRQRKETEPAPRDFSREKPAGTRHFMHMAWIANPLAYVAINTIIPLIPSISGKIGLTTGIAGMVCSVWMFARLGTFAILWRWTGWHYRFGWLIGSFAVLLTSFTVLVNASSVITIIIAQVGFGASVGLIYYSSLYYSMNVSEKKGAHGGFHEAMIGTGLLVGPACGASAFLLLPSETNGGVLSVSGILIIGFSGLLWMGGRGKKPLEPARLD